MSILCFNSVLISVVTTDISVFRSDYNLEVSLIKVSINDISKYKYSDRLVYHFMVDTRTTNIILVVETPDMKGLMHYDNN